MNGGSDRLMNETVRAVGRFLLDALVTGLAHYGAAYHGLPPSALAAKCTDVGRDDPPHRWMPLESTKNPEIT